MRKSFYSLILLFVSVLLITACKNNSKLVTISQTNFSDVLNVNDNVEFTFNRAMVADSLINRWTKEKLIEFKPEIRGEFRWEQANKLVFSPYKDFKVHSEYEAKLTNKTKKYLSNEYVLDDKLVLKFKTEPLKIESTDLLWYLKSANPNDGSLRANVTFNHEIKPNTFASKIKVSIDDKVYNTKISNATFGKILPIEILVDSSVKDAKNVKIEISNGYEVLDSENNVALPFTAESEMPSANLVSVSNLSANHNGASGELIVYTNQQINPDNLASHISIEPKVVFEANTNAAGIIIKSADFNIEKDYSITISEDLTGTFGGKLKTEYTGQFSFGSLNPEIKFPDQKSEFLTSKGYKNVGIQIVNVPLVNVTITKVFENNIIPLLKADKEYNYENEYNEETENWEYHNYETYPTNDYGKVIYNKLVETKDLETAGRVRLLNLNFRDKLRDYKGLYIVEVKHPDKKFITDSKLISISDIGLIAKETDDEVYVFANSIKTSKPISAMEVTLIDRTNQVLASAPTDGDGVAIIKKNKFKIPDAEVAMLTAENNADFNYLHLNKTSLNTSRFEVGGLKNHESNYHAFLYGERELYRPGETINFSGIVRSTNWRNPGELPFKVKCLLPSGKEYKTVRKVLNKQGAFETSIDLSPTASTGSYQMELYTGNDILVETKSIKVEEFMPDRIKLDTEVDSDNYEPGNEVSLNLQAQNFFGPPAKNRKYESEMTIQKIAFNPKEFSDYYFNINNPQKFERKLNSNKTNDEGEGTETFTIPEYLVDMGKLRGRIFTTIFDETGRPVSQSNSFDIYTQKVFYGVRQFNRYLDTNQPVEMQFIALNKNEELLSGEKMQLQILRHYYRTVLEKDGRGRYRYKSYKQTDIVDDKVITLDEQLTNYTFIPQESGRYELRFGEPDNQHKVAYNFSAYGRGDTQFSSFDVDREGRIAMEFDKKEYNVGEQATVLLKTPFSGKVLVTIERDDVIKHFYTNTDKKTAEVTLDITPKMSPNAYISATLIRPIDDPSTPLTVAYGYENIPVINSRKQLPLEIEAKAKTRSKRTQTITVKSNPNTEMTLAVVDEGILQITNYDTPNPYNFFYQKRGLEVESYDLYPYLFPEIADAGLLRGGGDGSMDKRSVGFSNKRINLVSYWSGIKKTNSKGELTFDIDVPQFSGDLRIMAVAYNNDNFSSASKNMIVADPVVISTGLPRFLSPGDELKIPVTVSNTTNFDKKGNIKIKTTGPIELQFDDIVEVNIPPNDETSFVFEAKVAKVLGDSNVLVEVNTGDEVFSESLDIMVRPASPLQKQSGGGSIKANTNESINFANEFIPESIDGHLRISKSPIAQMGDKLDYLLRYPHGCLEQTISKAFPLVYLEDLLMDMTTDYRSSKKLDPHYLAQEAIYKLQSMQLSNGGLTYWKSYRSKEHWWGSIYAAHFLVEAKKAGYEVNDRILNKLLKYIKQKVKTKETVAYYFKGNINQEYVRREIAYSLFVLALAGQPDIPSMNYYKSNSDMLTDDSRYMVAAAYGLAGDKEKFRKLAAGSFSGKEAIGEFDGSFSSYIRDLSISLFVLLEIEPDNTEIPKIAQKLSEGFTKKKTFNTQEASFALMSLGKLAQQNRNDKVAAKVIQNGKTIAQFNGKDDVSIDYADVKNQALNIETTGEGSLYYFWQLEGLSTKNEVEEVDNFLEVRKTFYDRAGNLIDINKVEQNDLIVIKLSLRSKDKTVENVVVTDILPAGFEIENPRLSESADMSWQKYKGQYDHIDFRDDRVHIYATANPNKTRYSNYYYTVRAVSKGQYIMGPASADAMYNGDYYSYNGGGLVTIE